MPNIDLNYQAIVARQRELIAQRERAHLAGCLKKARRQRR